MKNDDILIKTESGLFGFRIAGVLIRNNKVLIQTALGDTAYAFPGGHVSFLESSEETLKREFKEELCADISVHRLLWVEENFWKWGSNNCHHICFYYLVTLKDEKQIPLDGVFQVKEQIENEKTKLEFSWVELEKLKEKEFYPVFAKEKILKLSNHIEHFISKQIE